MNQPNPTNEELDERLVDMVEKHFPKGECKERGNAMVLLADFLNWHKEDVAEQVRLARVDERRQFIEDDKNGHNAVYIAKQKQLEYHDHQFDINSFRCSCGISKAEAQSLDRLATLTPQSDTKGGSDE